MTTLHILKSLKDLQKSMELSCLRASHNLETSQDRSPMTITLQKLEIILHNWPLTSLEKAQITQDKSQTRDYILSSIQFRRQVLNNLSRMETMSLSIQLWEHREMQTSMSLQRSQAHSTQSKKNAYSSSERPRCKSYKVMPGGTFSSQNKRLMRWLKIWLHRAGTKGHQDNKQ